MGTRFEEPNFERKGRMNQTLKRIAGGLLVLLAAASLVVSLFILVQVWRIRAPVHTSVSQGLETISNTLETASQVLHVTGVSLEAASSSITTLQGTVDTLGNSINTFTPMVDSIQTLTSGTLPGAVKTVQKSLDAAKGSADVIDGVLRTLTQFNPGLYNPATPLGESLGQASKGLDSVNSSLSSLDTSLTNTKDNLQAFKDKIAQISADMSQLNRNLTEARDLVSRYEDSMARMQASIRRMQANLWLFINAMAVVVTFVIMWLGVVQVWVLVKGWEMTEIKFWNRSRPARLVPDRNPHDKDK